MIPIRTKSRAVTFTELTPALLHIFNTLSKLAPIDLPKELVITSINDGQHMVGSKHYTNQAIDLRSHNFANRDARRRFRQRLEDALNAHPVSANRFRVLLESEGKDNEHFHIQVAKGKQFP